MLKTLISVITILILLSILVSAVDQDLNEIYCELNELARQRVLNNLDVFPCNRAS